MIQKSKEQLEKEAKLLYEMLTKKGFSKEYSIKEVYLQTGIKLNVTL